MLLISSTFSLFASKIYISINIYIYMYQVLRLPTFFSFHRTLSLSLSLSPCVFFPFFNLYLAVKLPVKFLVLVVHFSKSYAGAFHAHNLAGGRDRESCWVTSKKRPQIAIDKEGDVEEKMFCVSFWLRSRRNPAREREKE